VIGKTGTALNQTVLERITAIHYNLTKASLDGDTQIWRKANVRIYK
jgi:hypothetical protein